jgi:putative phage-type endonuclease
MKKLKYTALNLEQRSEDWLEWRKSGIGASEASVIMGSLPFIFEDTLELWKKKTGLPVPEFQMNDAIQLGIDTEDEALEKFTDATGIKMEPKCFTHPEYSYLRASLDGIDKKLKQGVEIKCPSATKYYTAKKGIVIPYYYTQVQQQMACSGLQEIYYWVYRQKEGGVLIKVPRNEEYIKELYRRAEIFWNKVLEEEPCLPQHLGINQFLDSDPYEVGDMSVELVGTYKN